MRASYLLLLAGIAASLAACSSAPVVVPQEVRVEVPVACVSSVPARPATRTDEALLALDRYRRTLAVWSDLHALRAYAAELEAVVEGCSRIPEK